MQLTKHTDFAFRVLIYLANMPQEKTTISEITEIYGISRTHLMKVVNALANEGWVHSSRGKGGGICLGMPPEQISAKDVLVRMEKTLTPVDCKTPVCHINGACKLQGVLYGAQQAFLDHLAPYTLADLVWQKTQERIVDNDIGKAVTWK